MYGRCSSPKWRPDYLLSRNKDFGRHHFNDRLTLSRDVFGVRGISTWAGSDPSTDRFSGFSIRANRHGLFCADSNVREEPEDGTNYDVLTEIALNEGFDVDSAVDALNKALRTGPYWCANLIMIDPFTIAVVEVRSDDLFVTRETNQATTMSTSDLPIRTTTQSRARYAWNVPPGG